MGQINQYNNRTAYDADTSRLATKSAVSQISNESAIIYDGVNAIAPKSSADVGDLVVFDKTTTTVKVVKAATVNKAQLPNNLTPIGVVYARRGKMAYMVALDDVPSVRWAASYEVALSGFDLSAGGSFVLQFASTQYTFTYTSGTMADVATQINATLVANGLNTTAKGGWTATASDNSVIMSSNSASAGWATIVAVSGVTITRTADDKNYQTTLTGLLIDGSTEYVRRNNRVNSYEAGCNLAKFLQYYSAKGTTPTSNIPVGSSTIVNQTSFEESEFCTDLRAKYNTYDAYLYGEHLLQYPASYGAILRDGKTNTAKIGALQFTDIRSATSPCYPAAATALSFGVTAEGYTTGFEAGAWWLPSVEEMFLLMRDRAYSSATLAADPVNTTLVRMAKATCYGYGLLLWTSCEYSSDRAFICTGGNGSVYVFSKCDTYSVRPVSAFQMTV